MSAPQGNPDTTIKEARLPHRAYMDVNFNYALVPELALPAEVRTAALQHEKKLGQELHEILNSPDAWYEDNHSFTFFGQVFSDAKGIEMVEQACNGLPLNFRELNYQEQAEVLKARDYQELNRNFTGNTGSSKPKSFWRELTGYSKDVVTENMITEFVANDFYVNDTVRDPLAVNVVLEPEKFIAQVSALLAFKKEKLQKLKIAADGQPDGQTPEARAANLVTEMYRRRINEIIVSDYKYAIWFYQDLKDEGLQAKLSELYPALKYPDGPGNREAQRRFAEIDEFQEGAEQVPRDLAAATDSNAADLRFAQVYAGDYVPVGAQLLKLYDELIAQINAGQEGAVDPEFDEYNPDLHLPVGWGPDLKFAELKGVSWKAYEIRDLFCKVLAHYGALSADQEVDLNNITASADGLYRVIIDPQKKTFAVDHRKKIITIGKNMDVPLYPQPGKAGLLGLCDHEMTHVLQQLNAKKLGLELVSEIGMDRAGLISEAGAAEAERASRREYFRVESLGNPMYTAAVLKRLQGGSFKDCVKAFFDVQLAKAKLEPDDMHGKQELLSTAINRVMRIFRDGGVFSSHDPLVTDSKVLNYLERDLLVWNLGMHKELIYLGRVDLDILNRMLSCGLVTLPELQIPDPLPSLSVLPEILQQLRQKQRELGIIKE